MCSSSFSKTLSSAILEKNLVSLFMNADLWVNYKSDINSKESDKLSLVSL